MVNAEPITQCAERRNRQPVGRLPVWALILCSAFIVHRSSLPARAAPSQDDVFKSIQSNVHSDSGDSGKVLGFLAAIAGAVVLIVAISQIQRPKSDQPKTLNHQGKLVRELMKSAGLKSAQIRQLKSLREDLEAKGKPVEQLVTLLLCPSLIKQAREPRDDRES